MKAAVYCRISRDRKVDGTYTTLGVQRQEEDCRGLCDTLGWEVAEVFVDNDISAASGRTRPAYKAMLAAMQEGRVDAIVCWHPDRLYRRTVDLEELVKVCDKHRVPIATVNAGTVDLTTPTGRLVAGLLAQVARYEGEHKAERWRRSFQQRREAGTPATGGSRMYGWTRDGALVEHEAAVIRYVAAELLAGATLVGVCRTMFEMGLVTTRGNVWKPPALKKLLTNPRLAGWVSIKGEIVAPSNWPRILEQGEWEAVRDLITSRRGGKQRPRKSTLLGVTYCGRCGNAMRTGNRGPQGGAAGTRTYRCATPYGGTTAGCTEIMAVPTEEIVEAYARERLADPRVRAALQSVREGGLAQRLGYEIATLEARLLELQTQLEESDTPVAVVMRAITRIQERLDEAHRELAEATPVRLPETAGWPEDVARRNALVTLVVERVDIQPARARGRFDQTRITITPRV